MPSVTRTVAKGIVPRKHEPGRPTKRKPSANKAGKKKVAPNLKRHATESDDDQSEERSDSEDSEPKAKTQRKSRTKRQRQDLSEEEEEVVDDDADEPEVEEIEDMDNQPEISDGNVISTNPPHSYTVDSHVHRMTGLMTINVVRTCKKSR